MALLLPFVPDLPHYRVGTTLGGVPYLIDVRWNERAEAWYLDFLTEQGDLIRAGIKVVLGYAIGHRVVDARFPPGILMPVDRSKTGQEAGLSDLGSRVVVYYLSPAELEA